MPSSCRCPTFFTYPSRPWTGMYGAPLLWPDPRAKLCTNPAPPKNEGESSPMSSAPRIIPPALQGVYDNWHFAPAVVSNGLIFCSGIIGTSPDGEPPAEDGLAGAQATADAPTNALTELMAVRDPEAQFATAFEALRAILQAAGAELSDVVEITTYHVDMSRHMATFMAVKDRYLPPPFPAWTAIGVAELIVPGGLMEIRAVAEAPSDDG